MEGRSCWLVLLAILVAGTVVCQAETPDPLAEETLDTTAAPTGVQLIDEGSGDGSEAPPTTPAATTNRTSPMTCLLCTNESVETCNMFNTPVTCLNIDDVCHWTMLRNDQGGVTMNKGCMSKPECESKHMNNGDECETAEVSTSCTWCCESKDDCNIDSKPVRHDPCNPGACGLSGEQFSDPNNCSSYFICDYAGNWDHATCPPGQLYDKVTLYCRDASRARCQEPCEQPTTQATQPPVTHDPCNPGACGLSGEQFGDPNNCSSYFICDYARNWDHVTCPFGQLYDKVTLYCVDAEQATCQEPCGQPSTTVPTVTHDPCNPGTCGLSGEQFGDPNNCTSYFICDYAHNWDHVTCPFGQLYDKVTLYCVDADQATCEEPCGQPSTTVPIASSTTPASTCDLYHYEQCAEKLHALIMIAATHPNEMFKHFCRYQEDFIRCAEVVENCESCSSNRPLNMTLLRVLFQGISSLCERTCELDAGFLCVFEYYQRIIVSVSAGLDCIAIARIEAEQLTCVARAVLNCNSTQRALIEASFGAIQAQVWIICANNPPTKPPPAVTEPPSCNIELARQCIVDFGVDVLAYYNNNKDIGIVCSSMELKLQCYTEASASCSAYTRWSLEASWNLTVGLISTQCVAFVKPKCDLIKARACILELWNMVDISHDFQTACNMINATLTCVSIQIAACSLDEIVMINKSLEVVIKAIGDKCDNIIDIWPGDGHPIDICEGGDIANIIYRLRQRPSGICRSDEKDCRIFIDIDISIDIDIDINTPRCRDGSVIEQVAVGSADGMVASTATGEGIVWREVTDDNWNSNQTISVAARLDFKYDGNHTRYLAVRLVKQVAGVITERRSLANFTLRICDNDRPATCSSINDPHIKTFDGRYYNNFQEGFFVMYQHKRLPYEVQIVTQRCNSQASCNCAAGVRSGDTVFFVDSCRKKGFVSKRCGQQGEGKYNCHNLMKVSLYTHTIITPGTHIYSHNNGKEFIVVLPHGTTVKIVVNSQYINVWVTASPIDWKNTIGLCGYFDGNPGNDFYLRDGTVYEGDDGNHGKQPVPFNNDWRVPDAEVMYNGVSENAFTPAIYCVRKVVRQHGHGDDGITYVTYCDSDALLETCDWKNDGIEITMNSTYDNTPEKRRKPGRGHRQRRATTTSGLDDFDVETGFVPQPIGNGNRTAAELQCKEYFDKFADAKACFSNNVVNIADNIDICVDDLLVTGNDTWMKTALSAILEQCTQELSRNPSFQNVADGILAVSCPNQCNDHGNCINGVCQCQTGYNGTDCGFDLNAKIDLVTPVNEGLCDTRNENCQRVQLMGVGFIPGVTRCTITPVKVGETEVTIAGEPINIGLATFVSPSEIHCPVTTQTSARVQLSNSNSVTKAATTAAAVNDSSPIFVVYDSTCYKCYLENDDPSKPRCKRLSDNCVIDGICYGPGEESEYDECRVCRPEMSESKFSASDAESCHETTRNGLIIGLTIGLTAFVVIVVAVAVGVYRHKQKLARSAAITERRTACNVYENHQLPNMAPPSYDDKSASSFGYKNGVFVDLNASTQQL